jgi:hypothetical protein
MSVPKELVELANGNYHVDPRLRAARVGKVSAGFLARLSQDVKHISENLPSTSVQTQGHITNWTRPKGDVQQWSLWNSRGRTDSTAEDFNYVLTGRRAPDNCPTIQALAESLPSLANMRLNYLGPGGGALSPHEEHLPFVIDEERVGLRCRFHLPIITNPKCRMLADNQWYHFVVGNVYAFNNGCVHAAENNGDTDRYHLVWDQLMTEEAYNAMFVDGTQHITLDRGAAKRAGRLDVQDYARSGGVLKAEFDKRELVFMP